MNKPATPLPLVATIKPHKQGTIIEVDGSPLALIYGETREDSELDAAYIVAAANAFPRLVEALDLVAATVELHTANGARSQPQWPRDNNGDIDYDAVAKKARSLLRELGEL